MSDLLGNLPTYSTTHCEWGLSMMIAYYARDQQNTHKKNCLEDLNELYHDGDASA